MIFKVRLAKDIAKDKYTSSPLANSLYRCSFFSKKKSTNPDFYDLKIKVTAKHSVLYLLKSFQALITAPSSSSSPPSSKQPAEASTASEAPFCDASAGTKKSDTSPAKPSNLTTS